jgi:hypothetical protein
MAKSSSKPKLDAKQLLLNKGEYLALSIGGFALLLLLILGVMTLAQAEDPQKIAKDLTQKANSLRTRINDPNAQPTPQDLEAVQVPDWVEKGVVFKPADVTAFPIRTPLFDTVAKPDPRKERPFVVPIRQYQVDLFRGAMYAYDIITDPSTGKSLIGVLSEKKGGSHDKSKAKDIARLLASRGRVKPKKDAPQPKQPAGGGFGPPGIGGPPGLPPGGGPPGMPPGLPPGPGGGPSEPGMGGPGDELGGYNPYGYMGGRYDTSAQRVEKVLEYIPLEEGKLNDALSKGKIPAMTVMPLRAIIVHAEVPLKLQREEFKRALRLKDTSEAARYGPVYDGFVVQRRITQINPKDGKVIVRQDWADFDFEKLYMEVIWPRKLADHIEEGYIAYFVRYDMALALPLPQIVEELGTYPEVRLPSIVETIQKMQKADEKPVQASETLKRLQGAATRRDIYKPETGRTTGAATLYGSGFTGPGAPDDVTGGGPGFPPMGGGLQPPFIPGGAGGPPGAGAPAGTGGFDPTQYYAGMPKKVDIEHLLLRFIDVDVQPGFTYEYRIRLRMRNPNYNRPNEVANPADAKVEFLESPWTTLDRPITVPPESFLFAGDTSDYRKRIDEEYGKDRNTRELRELIQVKESQAVVELASWMEQVRTDSSGKREPVGAWVFVEIPTGRGEFIGRKHYIKLPLWSSEAQAYVLREIPDKVIPTRPGQKEASQPKGWIVNFSTPAILVDFEGGIFRGRVGNRDIQEEAATELLVLRADGKLEVRKSQVDQKDSVRKRIAEMWDKWVKAAEKRKTNESSTPGDGFSPRTPPGGSSP